MKKINSERNIQINPKLELRKENYGNLFLEREQFLNKSIKNINFEPKLKTICNKDVGHEICVRENHDVYTRKNPSRYNHQDSTISHTFEKQAIQKDTPLKDNKTNKINVVTLNYSRSERSWKKSLNLWKQHHTSSIVKKMIKSNKKFSATKGINNDKIFNIKTITGRNFINNSSKVLTSSNLENLSFNIDKSKESELGLIDKLTVVQPTYAQSSKLREFICFSKINPDFKINQKREPINILQPLNFPLRKTKNFLMMNIQIK